MTWAITLTDCDALLEEWGRFVRDFNPRVSWPDTASPFDLIRRQDESLNWGLDEDRSAEETGYDYIQSGITDNWLRSMRGAQERYFDILRRWYFHRKRKHISESELGEAQRAFLDVYQPHKAPRASTPPPRYGPWSADDLEAA